MIVQEPEHWKMRTAQQWERILFSQTLDEWCKSKWEQGVLEREYKNKNESNNRSPMVTTELPTKNN